VHPLAERVLSHIRRQDLLKAGDRVGVTVSGGIDSVALLRLLLELRHELGIVLSVVHFNHKLRGAESDADQEFVAGLAREHDLEFHTGSEDVAARAAEEQVSVETAARELRYGFFRQLLGEERAAHVQRLKPDSVLSPEGTAATVPFPTPSFPSSPWSNPPLPGKANLLTKILTGHTLDDQAETVLMRMIRGSGLRGLSSIHPRIVVGDDDGEVSGEIVRPLLGVRRLELEKYLRDFAQPWREDSSNADHRFTRNRVRNLVLPLLEKQFNPAVAENLAELAEIARGEEDYWENEISGWLGTTVQWTEPDWVRALAEKMSLVQISPLGNQARDSSKHSDLRSKIDNSEWLVMNASVSRMWFLGEPIAVQRRLVKAIGENARIPLGFRHVEEILRVAAEDDGSGKELSLPRGWKLVREPEQLVFVTPDLREPLPAENKDYEYELAVPGQTVVYQADSCIEARSIPPGEQPGYNLGYLLDADSLPGPLRVRNWRAGDRFWPAHTKSPKKIKELLQERHVAQPDRRFWPVIVSGNEIVWVRGFPCGARFQAKPGKAAILIEDGPLIHQPETQH